MKCSTKLKFFILNSYTIFLLTGTNPISFFHMGIQWILWHVYVTKQVINSVNQIKQVNNLQNLMMNEWMNEWMNIYFSLVNTIINEKILERHLQCSLRHRTSLEVLLLSFLIKKTYPIIMIWQQIVGTMFLFSLGIMGNFYFLTSSSLCDRELLLFLKMKVICLKFLKMSFF